MAQKILLTDDSPAARSILKLFLAPLGAEFVEAEQAERALQVLRLMTVDLVIADFNMPGMDGVSFVTATREHPRGSVRKVPIILLTASRQPGLEEAALRAGASAFLAKPVDSEQIVGAARRLLGLPPERAARAVG